MTPTTQTITSTQALETTGTPSTFGIPLYTSRISAGFASPADDHLEKKIDLNQLLIPKPAATFMLRVEGESMIGAGIHDGDLLIVDRSVTARHGSVVIAGVHGELTVKRLRQDQTGTWLMPENPEYRPIPVGEDSDFLIWGCVTNVIHNLE